MHADADAVLSLLAVIAPESVDRRIQNHGRPKHHVATVNF
jgi:hypothetical protein